MSCSYDSEPSGKPGVHCKLPEISSFTNYNYRISGISCRLKNLDFISSKGQDKETEKSMSVNLRQPTAINTTTFGLPNVHHSGSLPCTNSFSVLTNRQEQSLKYLPGLLGNSPTQSTCTGRVTLVEGQFGSLEWESTSFRGTRSNNRNRCFLQRVGSLLQGSNNWGKMVSPGTTPPYKLSGTVSRSICPQGLHKEQGSNVGPSVDGQYISSTLHHLILASLAKDLWEWCLECQIVLEAQHIPGILNVEQTGSPRSLSTTTIESLHPMYSTI